ncbi:MAG: hypothetical protein HOP06_04750 [Methylotenera sp.]|nr:hypothetical protein [Methylotenera sp.]
MSVSNLDQAIASHPFFPKGIKVGSKLWKDLVVAGRIKWKRGYIEGVIDSGIDFPTLDEKIFVHVEPELDDLSYELPQNS